VPTLVSQLLQSTWEQPAIIFNDTEISFESITTAVKRLATGLMERGVEKGDRVAILLPNVPHFCISYYATLLAHAIAVPLNFMHDSVELGHQLSDSGAKILITWQSFLPQILHVYKSTPTCKDLLLLGDRISQDGASLTQIIAESHPLDIIPDISETDSAVITIPQASQTQQWVRN
jgi:long-chain acyl-CoA synthetase